MMNKQEMQAFRELFSKYCRQEINKGHCESDGCEFCSVNSAYLFDQGYRIFLHFKSGTVTEVGRGENPALPVRIIRENMNLEAPLLAGLLGKLTE